MNTITLNVEPYLAAWLTRHFGNPIELLKDGPEAKLLKRLLDKQPDNITPETGNISVSLQYFKDKDPRVYSYLCESGKYALIESFEAMFVNNMWSEIGNLENLNCRLTSVIRGWCEKHGIIQPTNHITEMNLLKQVEEQNARNFETVRQKYYRLRKKYYRHAGVKLS
ncbi:hypothetical protein K6V26_20780 [Parabacteroides goldsteinii]|jgi:hypothetical protein|uniref:hypothetical protein n=1 Tax=Parabacteroides goldsteinii TaxID=328812 RepID=UPI001CCCD4CD|nr:hypothetical protein [Parabacteroides goldsteinii]UBD73556.1 hypothetical protein K6V26_20780 [Parabacteroides goldsteinii]